MIHKIAVLTHGFPPPENYCHEDSCTTDLTNAACGKHASNSAFRNIVCSTIPLGYNRFC